MLTKVAPLLRAAPCMQSVRHMGHGYPTHWKSMKQICEENKSHMNFMPVPEGSWKEYHSKRNGKWNLMLATSLVACIVTYGFLWNTGCIYLHSAPPMYNVKQ